MSEQEPLVSVLFSLGSHDLNGVSVLPTLKRQLKRHFKKGPDTANHFWMEASDLSTPRQVELGRLLTAGESFRDSPILLEVMESKKLSFEERDNAREEASQIRDNLLGNPPAPSASVHEQGLYFMHHELDMLDELKAEGYSIQLSWEHRSARSSRDLTRFYNYMLKVKKYALNRFLSGDVVEGYYFFRECIYGYTRWMEERNRPFVEGIGGQIQMALETKTPTRIAVRVGEAHDGMMERINRPYLDFPADQVLLQYSYDKGQHVKYPKDKIVQRLESDPLYIPTAQEVVRAAFAELLINFVPEYYDPRSIEILNRVLAGTPTPEIVRLFWACKNGNAGDLLLNFARSKLAY